MNLIHDFVTLLFPLTCLACGNNLYKNEQIICTSCLMHLPKTNFHLDPENLAVKIFWGRVRIEAATAQYFYRKGGKVQHLIHQMKYNGHKEVGILLGEIYGSILKDSDLFNSIDKIIPIPLHKSKLKKRGFNQAEMFAEGLSNAMKVEMDNKTVLRTVATSTQTKKSRYKRWENVSEIFEVAKPGEISGKHILLVDDVITTGATMEACIQAIQKIPDVRISVAAMAYAAQ
ncbi:MAG: ComF family protein [Bacteroidales bacterium]|nr:ComF family protein [Bacteroidales bacterium]